MYYPLVKQDQFGDMETLCRESGFDRATMDTYVANARIEGSALVMCDRLILGDPRRKVCAVVEIASDGSGVTLWAALIAEASEDRDDILAFIAKAQDVFDRPMAVGEYVARKQGALS